MTTPARPKTPAGSIDILSFPHILDAVIASASQATLLSIRATCRTAAAAAERCLCTQLTLSSHRPLSPTHAPPTLVFTTPSGHTPLPPLLFPALDPNSTTPSRTLLHDAITDYATTHATLLHTIRILTTPSDLLHPLTTWLADLIEASAAVTGQPPPQTLKLGHPLDSLIRAVDNLKLFHITPYIYAAPSRATPHPLFAAPITTIATHPTGPFQTLHMNNRPTVVLHYTLPLPPQQPLLNPIEPFYNGSRPRQLVLCFSPAPPLQPEHAASTAVRTCASAIARAPKGTNTVLVGLETISTSPQDVDQGTDFHQEWARQVASKAEPQVRSLTQQKFWREGEKEWGKTAADEAVLDMRSRLRVLSTAEWEAERGIWGIRQWGDVARGLGKERGSAAVGGEA